MKRRWWAIPAVLTALTVLTFILPVRGADECGPAGVWALHVLTAYDPTGPLDPPEVYAEFLACREAARAEVTLFLVAAVVAVFAWGAAALWRSRGDR